MSYREKDIMHETGDYWVLRSWDRYTVMRAGITHSVTDSGYSLTPAGLTLAIARADYLAKHRPGMAPAFRAVKGRK